jgi:hypothetical protein
MELKNVYIRRISTLYANITFKTSQLMANEKALLDSGATENFIDETTWQWLGIGHKELEKPITVTNVDGMENKRGKITHYCWLCIQKGTWDKLQSFFITDLGQDQIILGYPFLYHFNPPINWTAGRIWGAPIQLQSPCYKYVQRTILWMQMEAIRCHGRPKEGQALFVQWTNVAQQWAQEAEKGKVHLTLETIPEEYRQHAKVFSEEEAKRFPLDHEENITIKLKDDAPDVINCKIYPLTKDERELLQKWILDEEALGQIYMGSSLYTTPVYFIGKKDSQEKWIIMDYQRLNVSHSGDAWVGEGSTTPAKRTGVGSWITGNSAVALWGVDCGDPSGVIMSSALRVRDAGHE